MTELADRDRDRAADGRARMYGLELVALCDVADVAADGVVPTGALREIAARMTAAEPGPPQSLDAWRRKRVSEAEFDVLTREPR